MPRFKVGLLMKRRKELKETYGKTNIVNEELREKNKELRAKSAKLRRLNNKVS